MRIATQLFFLSCLCCVLSAQTRQSVDEEIRHRGFHPDRGIFTFGTGSASHFAPAPTQLLVNDAGFAVVSHLKGSSLDFTSFLVPDYNLTDTSFRLKGISADGEEVWQHIFTDAITWAGMTTLDVDRVYFVVHPYRIFILPPGSDETITTPELPANILVCVSLNSGRELWRTEVPGFISNLKPVNDGKVYVTYSQVLGIGNADQLAAFDRDGQSLWEFQLSGYEAGEARPE